jgi:hypothetical protein
MIKALLYEKNCEYLSSLSYYFIILKKFGKEKKFYKKESSKTINLINKINEIIGHLTQKYINRNNEQNKTKDSDFIAFVNFLEDYYSFLFKNNKWLKKIAFDSKKNILNILLEFGLFDNIWHCLFMLAPQKLQV